MLMPLPGRNSSGERAIVHVDGLRRLGSCPEGFALIESSEPESFTVSFAGIAWQSLSPDLADELGAMPVLLADPNVSGTIAASADGVWSAWWQTVNAGGCDVGQSDAIFVRLRRIGATGSAFVLEQYVYSRLAAGTCDSLLVFSGGGSDLAALYAAAATIENRSQADNAIGGVLALASGTATIAPVTQT